MTPWAHAVWEGLQFRLPMLLRNVEPLSEQQLGWTPGEGRKSIRWQLWHIAEVEDNWVRTCQLGEEPRFPFGVALADAGEHTRPGKGRLLEYLLEVRELSRARLEVLTPDDAAKRTRDPDFGELTLSQLWAGVVTSFAWHAGQAAQTSKLLPDSPVEVWDPTAWEGGGRRPL